jgi:hypothetical protein
LIHHLINIERIQYVNFFLQGNGAKEKKTKRIHTHTEKREKKRELLYNNNINNNTSKKKENVNG